MRTGGKTKHRLITCRVLDETASGVGSGVREKQKK